MGIWLVMEDEVRALPIVGKNLMAEEVAVLTAATKALARVEAVC